MDLTDNCSQCEQEYDLTVDNSCVQIFLRMPACNFIQATCPFCNVITRMYLVFEATCALINVLPIYVEVDAPEDIIEGATRLGIIEETVIPEQVVVLEELPDLPPQLRRELYDYFRETDHG